jgi:hypothetical protein
VSGNDLVLGMVWRPSSSARAAFYAPFSNHIADLLTVGFDILAPGAGVVRCASRSPSTLS